MAANKHALIRQTFEWKSAGRLHDENPKKTLLKDISDSHLLHLIGWVISHQNLYEQELTNVLIAEAVYRSDNYIFVEE